MGHLDLGGVWHESSFRLVETYDVEVERGWRIPLAEQPYGEVFWIRGGRCRLELAGETTTLGPGDVGILLPGPDRLTADVGSEPLRFVGFGFRLRLLGAIELSGLLGLPLRLPDPDDRVRDDVVGAVACSTGQDPAAAMRARARAELVVADLVARCGAVRSPGAPLRREVAHAIALMEADPGRAHDLAGLASEVHLSAKHFARLFRSVVGVPPMAYLQALRLSRARAALVEGERPIGAVAADLGFSDAAHFARSFRAHYGCTPTQLRDRSRALLSAPQRPGEAPPAQGEEAARGRASRGGNDLSPPDPRSTP